MTDRKALFESLILSRRRVNGHGVDVTDAAPSPIGPSPIEPGPMAKAVLEAIDVDRNSLHYVTSDACPTVDDSGAPVFLAKPGLNALIVHPDNARELRSLAYAYGVMAVDVGVSVAYCPAVTSARTTV